MPPGTFALMPAKPYMHSIKIVSIAQLLHELLRTRDTSDYADILARYPGVSHDLEPYLHWNLRSYTRTCIYRNGDFELLAVCYEPGQRTSIHDYDSQTAWVHPVLGEVLEERFVLNGTGLKPASATRLFVGGADSVNSTNAIHRFSNPSDRRAVTLNLYARPMSKWRMYDETTGTPTVSSVPSGE